MICYWCWDCTGAAQREVLAGVTALWIGLLILAIAVPFAVLGSQPMPRRPSNRRRSCCRARSLDVTIGGFAVAGLSCRLAEAGCRRSGGGDPGLEALQPTPSITDVDSSAGRQPLPAAWVMSHRMVQLSDLDLAAGRHVFGTPTLYWADTAWEQLPAQALLKVALSVQVPGWSPMIISRWSMRRATVWVMRSTLVASRCIGEQPATDLFAQSLPHTRLATRLPWTASSSVRRPRFPANRWRSPCNGKRCGSQTPITQYLLTS